MPRRPSHRLPFAVTLLANLVACAGPAATRPSARTPADSAAASDASAASVPPAPAPAGDAEASEAQVRHGRTTSVVPPVPAQDNSDADIWDGPDTIERVDPRAPARRR
ncbi:hypothetical protein OV203_18370 [Nannocystis sp. ILAH1]|nr:hypothetical protein [Nannocystis sp. ILAH1]MCY0989108.1 hypothetical protein [Nannocystis sp. ILAH1]